MNVPLDAVRHALGSGGRALGFAWRSLVRQPARASLGILGVAAVGALLFDMLMLSNGLLVSMRDLFDRAGFDLRVTATEALPGQGPRVPDAMTTVGAIARVPQVRAVIAVRFADASIETAATTRVQASFQGVGGIGIRPWTVLDGHEPRGARELLVNRNTANRLAIRPGSRVQVRASCVSDPSAVPPVMFTVTGIAEFPFDAPSGTTAATTMEAMGEACGSAVGGEADVIMVSSQDGAGVANAARAVAAVVPALQVLTNDEMVGHLERGGFSYFRQISTVLTAVTLSFAVLLITVLLTVSVNQRLGEIAALRALGFTRYRVVADVLCESALIVGGGGLLSLPLGGLLAAALDRILKNIPGIPEEVHFFVFQPGALGVHASLLVVTAIVAALYPMQLVARLPIAATLRDEVVG